MGKRQEATQTGRYTGRQAGGNTGDGQEATQTGR
jgi:hypothetical protein